MSDSTGGKMMDFISKLGEQIGETGKKVADITRTQTDILSLKSRMSSCDSVVKREYEEIGKIVYNMFKDEEELDLPYVEQIKIIKKNIKEKEELQQKIDILKNE